MNLSLHPNDQTATTRKSVAYQRAERLSKTGLHTLVETCVGPSLDTLQEAYGYYGIRVIGNDIDPRWEHYSTNLCIIGDVLKMEWPWWVVFAPPLSKGCSGKREDSLSIDEVTPRYYDFLDRNNHRGCMTLVLPGRSLATRRDRTQYYKLLAYISNWWLYSVTPMKDERGRITKYYDVDLTRIIDRTCRLVGSSQLCGE